MLFTLDERRNENSQTQCNTRPYKSKLLMRCSKLPQMKITDLIRVNYESNPTLFWRVLKAFATDSFVDD